MRSASCWRCKKIAMVNTCRIGPTVSDDLGCRDVELCADCFDVIGPTRSRRIQGGRGGNDEGNINPWQDNAIRSLEEDR
jgi:hypothetical protein